MDTTEPIADIKNKTGTPPIPPLTRIVKAPVTDTGDFSGMPPAVQERLRYAKTSARKRFNSPERSGFCHELPACPIIVQYTTPFGTGIKSRSQTGEPYHRHTIEMFEGTKGMT